MANDTYHIPGSSEKPLQEALTIADSFQYSPEKQLEPYRFIKDIEEKIYSYRETALALDAKRKQGFLGAIGLTRQPLTMTDLIEKEAQIGGEIFGKGKGYRLWLDHKGSSPYIHNNDIGDWYHTRPNTDGISKDPEITLHFESHPTHFWKLYEGKSYALTVAETETICDAIARYEEAIRVIYPFDEEIHNLEQEIEEEIIQAQADLPETREQRASREAVEEVIKRYEASVQAKQNVLKNEAKDNYDLAA